MTGTDVHTEASHQVGKIQTSRWGQHWGRLLAAGTGHRSMGRARVQNVKVTKKEEGTEQRDVATSR